MLHVNYQALDNSGLSEMTGWPKPTVSHPNLSNTLIELGYLRRRNDRRPL
jgi:hypothetical protein